MNSVYFLKILCFVSKGSLNILEYRCLLIGHVQYLYTIEHAVENIAYHMVSIDLCNSHISGVIIFKEKYKDNYKGWDGVQLY